MGSYILTCPGRMVVLKNTGCERGVRLKAHLSWLFGLASHSLRKLLSLSLRRLRNHLARCCARP